MIMKYKLLASLAGYKATESKKDKLVVNLSSQFLYFWLFSLHFPYFLLFASKFIVAMYVDIYVYVTWSIMINIRKHVILTGEQH